MLHQLMMMTRYSTVGLCLFAGLLGGAISRVLFIGDSVALAQGQKKQDENVIRAQRIELVNNHGVALAVFEVSYSLALPAGSPTLTLRDKDELQNKERKVVISTGTSSMRVGEKDSLILGAGAIMLQNAGGTDFIGMVPLNRSSFGNGVVIGAPGGVTTLDGARVTVSDRNGLPIATLP